MSDWERTRWWRAIDEDGTIWCEASNRQEVEAEMRPGDILQSLWKREEQEWRMENPQ